MISRALLVFGFLNTLAFAAGPQVEIRANEAWVVIDGQARQLTTDGRSKLQAELSPSATRIAGPIVHFAAPVDQSNYVFIDGSSVHPHEQRGKSKVHDIIRSALPL